MLKGRKIVLLAAVAITGVAVFVGATALAQSGSGPANKVAISASNMDKFDDTTPILEERVKVPTNHELMLQLTAECSILTALTTGGANPDTSEAEGTVNVWIEIDGTRVPVQTNDASDDGDIVLCNRAYGRSVTDTEGDGDVDEEDDFIRTRNANGFNWMAFNVGSKYDKPFNGNNVVDIKVMADYVTNEVGEATADAFVGKRTLLVEPTHAANSEGAEPVDENAPATSLAPVALPTGSSLP